MGHVRKVEQKARGNGSRKVSWRATWRDASGARRSKNFDRKGDADAHVRKHDGAELTGSADMTVLDLARAHNRHFNALVVLGDREQGTLDGYETFADHLTADRTLAAARLCDLDTPKIQRFLDDMLARTGSADLTRRMRRSLSTWCKFANPRGWLKGDPAKFAEVHVSDRPETDEEAVAIPPKAALSALLAAAAEGPAPERDTSVVRLLMFGGFRISELLGLADDAVALAREGGTVKVRERLERRYKTLGRVKSAKGRRDVPIGPAAAAAVRLWRVKRGPAQRFEHRDLKGKVEVKAGRLFPNPDGGSTWSYDEFIRDCWTPLLRRAGLAAFMPDGKGKKRWVVDFTPHALRHAAVSLWIEQQTPPKKVQELAGHSTLELTMNLYGHLWVDEALNDSVARRSEALIPMEKKG